MNTVQMRMTGTRPIRSFSERPVGNPQASHHAEPEMF
jgi:hypothetical protein